MFNQQDQSWRLRSGPATLTNIGGRHRRVLRWSPIRAACGVVTLSTRTERGPEQLRECGGPNNEQRRRRTQDEPPRFEMHESVWTGFPIDAGDNEIGNIVHELAEQVSHDYGLGRLEVLLRQALDGSESIARQLQELAWQRLHVGPWHETWIGWRHLYALSTCAVVNCLLDATAADDDDADDQRLRACLREIDLALLMGGEVCRARLQTCASEISRNLSARRSFPSLLISTAASLPPPPPPSPPSGATPVQRVSRLDILRFGREFFSQHRPVVVTESMEHWAAVSDPDRRWNQLSYLKTLCAFRTVPIEIGSQYTAEKWSQKLMTIAEFIDNHVVAGDAETGYLAQHDLLDQIPELQKDVATPDLVCVGADIESARSNVWFGPAGTVSPLHTDPDENLLCQVVGSKYIRLYAAEHTASLYPAPGLHSNTSQVDCLDVDAVKFPKFPSIPFFECELQRGEMLYIPAKMWHFVKSLSPSVSVNFWFR